MGPHDLFTKATITVISCVFVITIIIDIIIVIIIILTTIIIAISSNSSSDFIVVVIVVIIFRVGVVGILITNYLCHLPILEVVLS